MEKAEAKLRKSHEDYRAAVEKRNAIRDEFEKLMTTSCQVGSRIVEFKS